MTVSPNSLSRSGLMSTYTTEILPYGLRAKGYVWLNFSVTLALVRFSHICLHDLPLT